MRICLLLLIGCLLSSATFAHTGSPDVYYETSSGPYHLLVTIRPPAVVPGIAQVLVRSCNSDVAIDKIQILPLTIDGSGASLAPRPDTMRRSTEDPHLYTGNLWIMLRGSWKVQISVEGGHGKSELAVPVAAVSLTALRMNEKTSFLLGGFGLILAALFVGIIRAANGPAQVAPRQHISPSLKRRSRIGMSIGATFVVLLLIGGNVWWGVEARANEAMVYHVPQLQLSLQPGNRFLIHLENPNARSFAVSGWRNFWAQSVAMDDLVQDHGHLMHLFLVRLPDMKSFWHLHPDLISTQEFAANLPAMPPGRYKIYADIVHATGFPETQVGAFDLPDTSGQPTTGDDSGNAALVASGSIAQLSDGYRMVWEKETSSLRAQQAMIFRFRIETKDGKPAEDLEDYMGMAGHAVFLSDDGKVFAHVHPEGSVSMAALAMANASSGQFSGVNPVNSGTTMDAMNMRGMNNHSKNAGQTSSEVSFPYGFPQTGGYHLFVQVKRAGHVDTGVFTMQVEK